MFIYTIRDDLDNIKTRLSSIDSRQGIVNTDIAGQSERMDRLELRLGRVEIRLNFSDEKQ